MTKPTRITHQSTTLIDNVLVSHKLYSEHMCHLITEDISDHLPCMVLLPVLTSHEKDPFLITKRKLNEKIVNKIVEELGQQQWNLHQNDVNSAFNEPHDNILNIVDKNAPEKMVRKKIKKHIEPWIMKGIQNSIRKQRKLYYELNKVNVATCEHESCKKYKNCLQKLIRKSKRDYFSQQCIDHKANTKKLWDVINRVIMKTLHKHHVIEKLKIKGLLTTNGTDIANELGKYFAQVGKSFADKLPLPKTSPKEYLNKIPRENKSIYLFPMNTGEVKKLVHKLANKNSSGYDTISNKLLKAIIDEICIPLTEIINISLKTGIFPERMKHADVSPLYKSNSREDKGNYRPISLLITLSKVMEKIMYKCMYNFLENTNQLYVSQYGFKKKHSCEQAVSELLSEILKGQEKKKKTLALFLDLSKAFDTLSRKILFSKLDRYGIRGIALQWYCSYLKNRTMRVKCYTDNSNLSYSERHIIEYSTPQGSCLGPLLFLILSNDLHLNLLYTSCILFADDTTIYATH